MKKATWIALALGGLALFGATTFSLAQPGDKKLTEPEFAPKVLMIYCKDADRNAVLADVRVRRLGEKTFLVGKIPPWNPTKTAWDKATHWVAIEEVVTMFEFSNIEEAKKAQLESDEAGSEGGKAVRPSIEQD
jgi:hypothetical protein